MYHHTYHLWRFRQIDKKDLPTVLSWLTNLSSDQLIDKPSTLAILQQELNLAASSPSWEYQMALYNDKPAFIMVGLINSMRPRKNASPSFIYSLEIIMNPEYPRSKDFLFGAWYRAVARVFHTRNHIARVTTVLHIKQTLEKQILIRLNFTQNHDRKGLRIDELRFTCSRKNFILIATH